MHIYIYVFNQVACMPHGHLALRKRRERDWNLLQGIFDLLGCDKLTSDLTPELLQVPNSPRTHRFDEHE